MTQDAINNPERFGKINNSQESNLNGILDLLAKVDTTKNIDNEIPSMIQSMTGNPATISPELHMVLTAHGKNFLVKDKMTLAKCGGNITLQKPDAADNLDNPSKNQIGF